MQHVGVEAEHCVLIDDKNKKLVTGGNQLGLAISQKMWRRMCMKKKTWMIIAALILLIAGVLGFCFLRLRTEKREPVTFEQFRKYVEEKGYEFQNNEEKVPVDIVGKSCAANIRTDVKVEFTECVSDEVASQLFRNYIKLMENYKESNVAETTISFSDYGRYTMENSIAYMQITRIENTIMHVRVPKEAKQEVCDFMNDLGYLN